MSDLTNLVNIGKVLASELENVGINTAEELRKVGSKDAFIRLHLTVPSSCYNKLCALEGAIQEIRWHNLGKETKADLKAFLSSI